MVTNKNPDRLNKTYNKFYEALIEGGVESIVTAAYNIFDRPVLFTDGNYHLICQIPKKPIGNPIWDTLYEHKVLPTETIWQYQTNYLNDQVDTYKPFYADWGVVKDSPRIFGEVTHNGRILGHIAIFLLDKPLEEDDLEIAEIFINTLRIELTNRQSEYGRFHSSLSTYMTDLLDADTSYTTKHMAVEALKKKLQGNYALLVTPIGEKASQKAFASYVVIELAQRYRNTALVLYNECIVTLIGDVRSDNYEPLNNRLLTEIINFFAKHDLVSGSSNCFQDLKELYSRYRQALLTAKIAIASKNTHSGAYMEYAPMQMFVEIARKDIPEVYIHPVLYKIQKYDQENNTEYYNTLRVFSLSINNRDSAAAQLSIHRNTLLYRLNRIKDIFHLPYEEEKTALHLICSFLLLEAHNMM